MQLSRTTFRARAIPFAVLSFCLALQAAEPGDEFPSVGVIVHNLSPATAETVQKAQAECTRMFALAGIKLSWMNVSGDISWEGPLVVLRAVILPQAPSSRGRNVLGTALPGKIGGLQLFAYYDRVVHLGWSADVAVERVLAAALAHEIGHMLLRTSEHAAAGLMRGDWSKRELTELSQGTFGFTGAQSELMRSGLAATRTLNGTSRLAPQVRESEGQIGAHRGSDRLSEHLGPGHAVRMPCPTIRTPDLCFRAQPE
jgi:hypothetical protein